MPAPTCPARQGGLVTLRRTLRVWVVCPFRDLQFPNKALDRLKRGNLHTATLKEECKPAGYPPSRRINMRLLVKDAYCEGAGP